MTQAFFYDVPGTEGLYERIKAEIGQEPPKGLVLHLVTTHDGGLRHLNVWESGEDWERPPEPVEQSLEVVDVWTGA